MISKKLTTAAIASCLAVGSISGPASAANTVDNLGEVSIVAPTSGNVTYNRSDCVRPKINHWMYWNTNRRISGLRDKADNDTRSYEHEAQFEAYPGDYSSSGVTNLPSYYQDTPLDDPPGQYSRAAGSYRSSALVVNTWYYYNLKFSTPSVCIGSTIRYAVASQRSYHNGACFPSHAYCVTAKQGYPRDIVPITAGFRTNGTTYGYNYNQLQNPSFDAATPTQSWALRGASGGAANWKTYTGGYEGSRYLQFNCAGTVAGCSIYQDKNFGTHPDHQFTVEVALRCRASVSCPVTLRLWGLDITATEAAGRSYTVPNDGVWRRYSFRGTNYSNHLRLRWEIYNQHKSANVDVDFTTLLWSDRF